MIGDAKSSAAADRHLCGGCSAPLAADNTGRLCSRCHREQRDQLRTPPAQLRSDFWATDDFRAAFESQHIGRVLRAYRNHPRHLLLFGKALNQELLGRWLNLTQAQISKLENGKPEQNLETLQNYARILHVPPELLWFDLPGQSRFGSRVVVQDDGGIAEQADQLRLGLLDAFALTPSGQANMDDWDHVVDRLGSDTRWRAPNELASELLANLEEIRRAYSRSTSSYVLRRVARVAGQMSGLMSQSLLKLDNMKASLNWARTARMFAAETNDPDLRSWVQAQEAYYYFYADNLHTAIDAAQYAQEVAGSKHGVGSALAAALEARALAAQGRRLEALQALDRAETYTQGLDEAATIVSAFGYNEAQLRFHQSSALTQLGEGKLALPIQDQALALCSADDFMDRTLIHLDRADCLIADGDVSGGIEVAKGALESLDAPMAQGLIVNRVGRTLQTLPDGSEEELSVIELKELLRFINQYH